MKSISFSIRLNEKETAQVKEAAAKLGWSQTQLMKRASLLISQQVKECPPFELGTIITNLVMTEIDLA